MSERDSRERRRGGEEERRGGEKRRREEEEERRGEEERRRGGGEIIERCYVREVCVIIYGLQIHFGNWVGEIKVCWEEVRMGKR